MGPLNRGSASGAQTILGQRFECELLSECHMNEGGPPRSLVARGVCGE
jgi:hypothetical protein